MLHADLILLLHSHQVADGVCLLLSTACLLLCTAYRLLLFTAYRLLACLLLPLTRLLAIVCRLPALLAGAALAIAHTGVAGGIAYPYGLWDCLCYRRPVSLTDCLPMLALHVNLYAVITPAPGSIPRLSQPPLQRRPSVVTLAAHSSTYSSFPVCARSWLAHMSKKAYFGRTFLDLSALAGRSVSVSILAKHERCTTPNSISYMISHQAGAPQLLKSI